MNSPENPGTELATLVADEEVERFRVMIDARTRHADLWPLVRQLGSTKAFAEKIGMSQQRTGRWVNLKDVPNLAVEGHRRALDVLHTLTGKSFDEMWPAALRRAISEGRAALRRDVLLDTSMIQLAERAAQRLVLPSPEDGAIEADRREVLLNALGNLKFREREIIKLRYGLGDGFTYTLDEVARIFRITRERVRQIEMRALLKLRNRAHRLPFLRECKADPTLCSVAVPQSSGG